MSDEVGDWRDSLSAVGKAEADAAIGRLAERGNGARMPLSRPLGDGLFELRFTCEGRTQRITYVFEPGKQVITLTEFAKTRQNERLEIRRARRVRDLWLRGPGPARQWRTGERR